MKIKFTEGKTVDKLIVNDLTVRLDKTHPVRPGELYKGKDLIAVVPTTITHNGVHVRPIALIQFITILAMNGALISESKGGVFEELKAVSLNIFGNDYQRNVLPVTESADPEKHKYYQVCLDNGLWETGKEIMEGVLVKNTFFASSSIDGLSRRFFRVVSSTMIDQSANKNIVKQDLKQTYTFAVPFGEFGFKHELIEKIK